MEQSDSTDIENWTESGWRADTSDEAAAYEYGSTQTVDWGTNFYSVYSRSYTAHFYIGVRPDDSTKQSNTVYYNTNTASTPTQVSITLKTAAESADLSRFGWEQRGWRSDTTAKEDKQYDYGATVTVDWGTNFYETYRRNTTVQYKSHRE